MTTLRWCLRFGSHWNRWNRLKIGCNPILEWLHCFQWEQNHKRHRWVVGALTLTLLVNGPLKFFTIECFDGISLVHLLRSSRFVGAGLMSASPEVYPVQTNKDKVAFTALLALGVQGSKWLTCQIYFAPMNPSPTIIRLFFFLSLFWSISYFDLSNQWLIQDFPDGGVNSRERYANLLFFKNFAQKRWRL